MLSERFQSALNLSFSLHKDQVRKSTDGVPYFSHLMSVAALVQEAGGDEDTQIAALLHDAVEDQGGAATLQLIRDQFGDLVADVVSFCSEQFELDADGNKPPWRERKENHLKHLREIQKPLNEIQKRGVLIMMADKLHNARTTYESVIVQGDVVYERFRGGKDGMLWYLKSCSSVLGKLSDWPPIARRLADAVDALKDDLDGRKKIICVYGKYSNRYYDASTVLLERAAMFSIFRDFDQEGYYQDIKDDSYFKRLNQEILDLEDLNKRLEDGTVPSQFVSEAKRQVAEINRKRSQAKKHKLHMELYEKAIEGDYDSAAELANFTQQCTNRWEYDYIYTSEAEKLSP